MEFRGETLSISVVHINNPSGSEDTPVLVVHGYLGGVGNMTRLSGALHHYQNI